MSELLKDPGLLKTKAYINGEWVDADDGATFSVTNPANQEVIAEVASVGAKIQKNKRHHQRQTDSA